jgi:hypothetical protein
MNAQPNTTLAQASNDIRIMRVSMLGSPQQANVNLFLAPLIITRQFQKPVAEARNEYLKILDAAVPALARTPDIRGVYDEGAHWVSGPINPNYLRLYQFFARAGQTPLHTFLAVTYLRALRALVANDERETVAVFSGLEPFLRNATEVRVQAHGPIRSYGPDFVAHLVVETEARAKEDSDWATALDAAGKDFERLEAHVTPLLASAFGRRPRRPTRPTSIPKTGEIAIAGDPTEAWWRIPAMVSLSCVYLRCA